jgi:hypothetical protein
MSWVQRKQLPTMSGVPARGCTRNAKEWRVGMTEGNAPTWIRAGHVLAGREQVCTCDGR